MNPAKRLLAHALLVLSVPLAACGSGGGAVGTPSPADAADEGLDATADAVHGTVAFAAVVLAGDDLEGRACCPSRARRC